MNKQFEVSNMKCQGCVKHVSEALDKLAGIKDYQVDLDSKKVSVATDVDNATIIAAIKEAGYDAKAIA